MTTSLFSLAPISPTTLTEEAKGPTKTPSLLEQFIAFDLETTGIVAGIDQIVEIGAVRFVNGEVSDLFCTLVDPKRPIPPGASRVNGITDEMVAGKPRIEELLSPLAEFCGSDPLVAHNATFDAQFLTADIRRFEIKAPSGVVLDTLPMAKKILPGLANYKLGTLVQHLKIPSRQFHRAEQDAIYCGQVFWRLLQRLFQATSPGEEAAAKSSSLTPVLLEKLVTLTGKPAYYFPQLRPQPKQLSFFTMEDLQDLNTSP